MVKFGKKDFLWAVIVTIETVVVVVFLSFPIVNNIVRCQMFSEVIYNRVN